MFAVSFLTAFGGGSSAWSMISVLQPVQIGLQKLLWAGSAASGQVHLLQLGDGAARLQHSQALDLVTLGDGALLGLNDGLHFYAARDYGREIHSYSVTPTGALRAETAIAQLGGSSAAPSVLAAITLSDGAYLAVAASQGTGVSLLRLEGAAQAPQTVASLTDGPKTTLMGVSDMQQIWVGAQSFLAVASGVEDGLSLYRLGPGGSLSLTDSLTSKDGLWVSGISALEGATFADKSFVLAGSAGANALTVMRVNAQGVMFITEQLLDDRTSRFSGVSQIELAEVNGRMLVVAGGGDGGFSLLELLPNGRLFHHLAIEARDAWAGLAGALTGLELHQSGQNLQIFAAGAGGVMQFSLPLSQLGPLVQGTAGADRLGGSAADDLIFGGGGQDTLMGGLGDDVLIALQAGAHFYGGDGRDIFQPGPALARAAPPSYVQDYEKGIDRLDLGEWGRLYHPQALTITAQSDGAEIRFGSNVLRLYAQDGRSIAPDSWSVDDFLF